jgi:uncharacterized protein (TIGR02453 family)
MEAFIERLSGDLASFAPDLVASARVSLYRIYRDTRFSPDKTPLKTHVAAVFPHRRLSKHGGAGLYFEISPTGTRYGGGLYMPDPADLHRLREHVASNFTRFKSLVESPAFRRTYRRLHGEALQRVPRGFAADHPAAEYLKLRQFLAVVEQPPAFVASPRFYPIIVEAYRRLYPLIRFINEPLVAAHGNGDPLRGVPGRRIP